MMTDEHEIVPIEALNSAPETPPDESAGTAPEAEPDDGPKVESGPECEGITQAEDVPEEAGCPFKTHHIFPLRCGRKLHAAPDGVDAQPVCLMHSKDDRKQSEPLREEFW